MKAIGINMTWGLLILFILYCQFDINSLIGLVLFFLAAIAGIVINIIALKKLVEGEPKRYPVIGIVISGIVLIFSFILILIG